ncbi:hypothetical protein K1T71_004108 [Dendrolimus kikuchii]|uniref:Uncharacterized protein n=1 Tax=Dendrolimus kikuchii TaxID=765133 RepID=A0ACC1D9V8_9NEOP|nr:hypothetical protein K1T71_004108 [Dendrolimus kikuchii]
MVPLLQFIICRRHGNDANEVSVTHNSKLINANFKLYNYFINNNGGKTFEWQIIEKAQEYKLLPDMVECPMNLASCKVVCKIARVVDRVQWVCEGCGRRQPIRVGSFFFRLQCTILQTLQMILAWCEDADCEVVAEHFGVKSKIARQIYDRLDELVVNELKKTQLGGENSVVLAEMYPDCLNRLSPDTTDQPHVHRILMLADTNHIPTYYRLHVIKEDPKKGNLSNDCEILRAQLEEIVAQAVTPNSMLVTGNSLPVVDGSSSIQQLLQQCDVDMKHFLTSRIWRQGLTLCAASRDLCAGATSAQNQLCASSVQRYLDTATYRLRFGDGFYSHVISLIAERYTERCVANVAVAAEGCNV